MKRAISGQLALLALSGVLAFSAGATSSSTRIDHLSTAAAADVSGAHRSAWWNVSHVRGGDYLDDFDSYTLGSDIIGQGGWEGWAGDPNVGALVDDTFSASSPHSLDVVATTDVVHPFSTWNSGSFTISAQQYIPAGYAGESYFILQNTYPSSSSEHWSTQLKFNSVNGLVESDGLTAENPVSFVIGEWAEIRVEVDLDADSQSVFYNDQLLYTASWTSDTAPGGALNLGAIDLFGNGASSVYYDDIAVVQTGADFAVELSANPDNDEGPAGSTVTYTVTVSNTGLEDDSYDIAASGVWTATPSVTSIAVASGDSETFEVDVEIPGSANIGDDDVTTVTATSTGDPGVSDTLELTTTVGELEDCIFADGFEEGGNGNCPGGAVGEPGVYDNRDDFLANVLGGHYEEDFADVPVGGAGPSLNFSGDGFAYTVSVVGSGTNNLFNDPGIVSHDSAVDSLRVTFTGAPVTAVGGNFWGTDISFAPNGSQITVTLDDGTNEVYTSTGPADFLGFVTEAPILHITIDAADVPANSWATMDNLIVGAR